MSNFDVMEAVRLAARTPYAMTRVGLDYLEARLNGVSVPDPMSPLIQQLEISSAQACIHIEESFATDRRRYLALARVMRDLYAHASDYDLVTRFSQPGSVNINFIYPKEEIVRQMVEVPSTKMRKVVIPRNTTIFVDNDLALINLYPIEIRQPVHKGVASDKAPLTIVYNTDLKTPLQTLDDNVVKWDTITDPSGREYLNIRAHMLQLKRVSNIDSLEGDALNFDYNRPIEDKFHFARVFWSADGKVWNEFAITHNEFIYDVRVPTVIITVEENIVNFRIPPVYINSGKIPAGASIRTDMYLTYGEFSKDLSTLQAKSFSVDYPADIDDPTLERYSAPIRQLEHSIYSTESVDGGANGMSFNQMYQIIGNNANNVEIPITSAQIVTRLNNIGFDVIRNRDDLTDRVYLASKTLQPSPKSAFRSAISSGILSLETTLDSLVQYPGVWDNNKRVTISPDTLFKINEGILSILPGEQYPDKVAKTTENLINLINSGYYVFSPFHYVLDTNSDNFDLRAYYLQEPKQLSREFLSENKTTQLEISTTQFSIDRTPTGYCLTVMALVGANFKDLKPEQYFAQLGFIPDGESNYAYLNGRFAGSLNNKGADYYVWKFDFETTFDLDEKDNLIVKNFSIFTSEKRDLPLPMNTVFTLTYSVTDYLIDGLEHSDVDSYLGKALLPQDIYGVSVEKVEIVLGKALNSFWANHRSLGGNYEIKRYPEDVLGWYEKDEYATDPTTGKRIFEIVDGKVQFTLLHHKGDPIMGPDGKQTILFYKGAPILDENNNVQPISDRPVLRRIDLFMVDGVYYYANDASSIADVKYVPTSIVDEYIHRLETTMNNRKLEKTLIYMYPKKTIGAVSVLVDDAVNVSIQALLSFVVTIYATDDGYNDMDFQRSFENVISQTISNVLKNRTVSSSAIIAQINQNADERICGFDLKIYSGSKEVVTATMVDDSYRASIRRLAALGDDGKIIVKEDIKFQWDNHLPTE